MKKVILLISLMVMSSLFAGCFGGGSEVVGAGGGGDADGALNKEGEFNFGIDVAEDGTVTKVDVDGSRVPELEEEFGFSLPSDAEVFMFNPGRRSMGSFYSGMDMETLKAHLEEEAEMADYYLDGSWGNFGFQDYQSFMGTFEGGEGDLQIMIERQSPDARALVNLVLQR